jgi:hypothetical protein
MKSLKDQRSSTYSKNKYLHGRKDSEMESFNKAQPYWQASRSNSLNYDIKSRANNSLNAFRELKNTLKAKEHQGEEMKSTKPNFIIKKDIQEKEIKTTKPNFPPKARVNRAKRAQNLTKLRSTFYKSKVNPISEFNGKELTNALMRLRNKDNPEKPTEPKTNIISVNFTNAGRNHIKEHSKSDYNYNMPIKING